MQVNTLQTIQGFGRLSLLVVCTIAAWSDWQSRRIPNPLILAGLTAAVLLAFAECIVQGSWRALINRLPAGVLFMLLHWFLYYCGQMGAGDVKLALVIGLLLGWQQWTVYLSYYGLVLSSFSIYLIVRLRKFRHRSLPLAPVMGAACLLYLLHCLIM